MQMKYWLMKSEPEAFSIDNLQGMPGSSSCWDGVRNYQARNFMRDGMGVGDQAFFYHSNCKVPGIVGVVEIVSESYPDHTAFDPDSKYYDPKSTKSKPRWYMRDIKLLRKFKRIITLAELRDNHHLQNMLLLRPGNRLSITPVTEQEWQIIINTAD